MTLNSHVAYPTFPRAPVMVRELPCFAVPQAHNLEDSAREAASAKLSLRALCNASDEIQRLGARCAWKEFIYIAGNIMSDKSRIGVAISAISNAARSAVHDIFSVRVPFAVSANICPHHLL